MTRIVNIFAGVVSLFFTMTPVIAQEIKPVCFDSERNLHTVLNRVHAITEIFAGNNTKIVSGGNCFWQKPPTGQFRARFENLWANQNGLIFSIYELDYDRDGIKRFSIDGVFESRHWEVHDKNNCGRGYGLQKCVVARSCNAQDNWLNFSGGFLPDYMKLLSGCSQWRRG